MASKSLGLGKGLDAIFEDNFQTSSKNTTMLRISDIEPRANPNHDPKTGRFTEGPGKGSSAAGGISKENDKGKDGKELTNDENSGKIKFFIIGKSLGAAAKKYSVKMPDSNQHAKLAEGQKITGKTFAGKGTNKEIRVRHILESKYNIPAKEFEKVSGKGDVIIDGKRVTAELHWYEANGKKFEMKVKRVLK